MRTSGTLAGSRPATATPAPTSRSGTRCSRDARSKAGTPATLDLNVTVRICPPGGEPVSEDMDPLTGGPAQIAGAASRRSRRSGSVTSRCGRIRTRSRAWRCSARCSRRCAEREHRRQRLQGAFRYEFSRAAPGPRPFSVASLTRDSHGTERGDAHHIRGPRNSPASRCPMRCSTTSSNTPASRRAAAIGRATASSWCAIRRPARHSRSSRNPRRNDMRRRRAAGENPWNSIRAERAGGLGLRADQAATPADAPVPGRIGGARVRGRSEGRGLDRPVPRSGRSHQRRFDLPVRVERPARRPPRPGSAAPSPPSRSPARPGSRPCSTSRATSRSRRSCRSAGR